MEIFTYEGKKLNIIKKDDDIWFRAKTVAIILGYSNSRKAINDHVDSEDKCTLNELKSKGNESLPLTGNLKNTIYINESGLYSLILRSDMDKAKEFKRWVTKDVLPSIRKTGKYEFNNRPYKMLTFNINTEYDLHKKVVNFIANNYPKAILIPTLGENQINGNMRIKSYNMGYQKGACDLFIGNMHLKYSGFAIEFKTPTGYGKLSEEQEMMLQEYENNNYKILVSNDYDEIIKEIILYFQGVRIKCKHCSRKFKSTETLNNHLKFIHKHFFFFFKLIAHIFTNITLTVLLLHYLQILFAQN